MAPTPGTLASCLAIIIAMWAARTGVLVDALAVEFRADFDGATR